MILCPAQPFDLPAVMTIEHSAFIPPIQEKRRVFDDRLQLFPQGFFVLADTSEETVQKHGNALTAGYFTSELWQSFDAHDALTLQRQFALNHKIYKTHHADGGMLYISSFALLPQYRGHGLGASFFRAAVASLCCSLQQIHTVALLVSSEWLAARAIYEHAGFAPCCTLADFFPSLHAKHADGIVMTAPADRFRTAKLVTNANGAVIV